MLEASASPSAKIVPLRETIPDEAPIRLSVPFTSIEAALDAAIKLEAAATVAVLMLRAALPTGDLSVFSGVSQVFAALGRILSNSG